ncbi:MAG: hypothetical protein K0S73_311 [Stenotrophomonas rhizophila]|jgi:hypothetical protein|nr:hypothetical protein [Stenotrophomonas rhizophila]
MADTTIDILLREIRRRVYGLAIGYEPAQTSPSSVPTIQALSCLIRSRVSCSYSPL